MHGCVIGEPTGDKAGAQILAAGGNAIDAIVAAAMAGAVAAPHQTGMGGYGGCAVFAVDGGRKVVALDFNTVAPAAMQRDQFKPDAEGKVPGRVNEWGWLAAGVPGNLAGLQLALDRFGTKSFREVAQPAIQLARDGFIITPAFANVLRGASEQFAKDEGSRRLYLRNGKPPPAGERWSNPELAEMLATLAERNSAGSFYRGDIAQRIAGAFQKNGGLVAAKDLAAYQAREVKPLTLTLAGLTIHTAPLTAGGLTTLQALAALQAMNWRALPEGAQKLMARIEVLRLAWRDRLTLLGDPAHGDVPVARLLSDAYAEDCAGRIRAAVKAGKPLVHAVQPKPQGGTLSFAAADTRGNLAALTLTHGNSFGARVTVPGLGLTLGHGMSRFDTDPDHPNAPGPGKRPLHNMCPAVVTREGRALLAAGGRGGRKIPNALFELLTQFAVLGHDLNQSIAAPRMHTEGDRALNLEKHWPAEEAETLRQCGYNVTTAAGATLSAATVDPANGATAKAMR